jgi:hypothetical protein
MKVLSGCRREVVSDDFWISTDDQMEHEGAAVVNK